MQSCPGASCKAPRQEAVPCATPLSSGSQSALTVSCQAKSESPICLAIVGCEDVVRPCHMASILFCGSVQNITQQLARHCRFCDAMCGEALDTSSFLNRPVKMLRKESEQERVDTSWYAGRRVFEIGRRVRCSFAGRLLAVMEG